MRTGGHKLDACPITLPSLFKHFRVLEESGLVRSTKRRRIRTFRIVPRRLEFAEAWLTKQRSLWEGRLDQLDEHVIDPKLDLVLERHTDVSPAQVWKAWTQPEQVAKWFAPRPWTTAECEIDLRPGGRFKFVMRSPEGQLFPNVGCYLEVVPKERLVWTDALLPGFRPSAEPFFTAIVTLESDGKGGTKYTAIAMHRDEEGRKKHEAMGFHEGWGKVFEQLVEHIKSST